MTRASIRTDRAATIALLATLAVAALGWVVAWQRMAGMDMGSVTPLGPFAAFAAAWVPMTAAMMLPGAVPVVLRRARAGLPHAAKFSAGYLAGWSVVGVAVYALYRPHGTDAAGALVIAAGVYELTAIKARCRQRCRTTMNAGEFTVCCIGSTAGLMLLMLALGPMSLAWLSIVAAVATAQKLLPPRQAIDIPVAVAIIALGLFVLLDPTSVPGVVPAM